MTAIDEVAPQGVSVVSFLRAPQADDYTREEGHALQELLPHIRNCLRIQRELDAFRARVACLETALDQLAPGVLLLDAEGRVIYANAAAEAAFRRYAEIGLLGERLYLREPAANERLAAALTGAAIDALSRRTPVAIHVRARDGSPALNLLVAPFIASLRRRGRQACTLVLMTLPTQASPDAENYLRAVFGLTTAHARCACLLAEGLSLATIGERLSIARSTLRSHLQQLFAKTGTQRQAALVAAVRRALALRELLADDSSRD
jgi:DNA-binding CsgD family transcriptional regulator